MNLTNAVALITGGSAGIGYSIAKTLSEAGARVAITGRHPERLAEAAKSLGVLPIQGDVSKEADVERTYKEVLAKFGDLDILINNAGIGTFKPLVEIEKANFDAIFATNVTGAMLMAREAAKIFIKTQPRQHHQHRLHCQPPRSPQRHCLLRQQVRPPRHD